MGELRQSIAAGAASSTNSSVHLDGEQMPSQQSACCNCDRKINGDGVLTSRPATVETPTGGDSRHKLFLGTFIHSTSLAELKYRHKAAICVSKEGTIVAIEDECNQERAEEVLFPRLGWSGDEVEVFAASAGQFLFPGFIDTHIHAPQYPNSGIFGKSTLLDWLTTYTFPLEASLADPAKARRVYGRCISKTLAHGTTCAAYYATIDVPSTNLLADLCMAAGQRALVGKVCMDQLSPDWYREESDEVSLQAARDSIAHISKIDPEFQTVKPIITPRFAPSCSVELLSALGRLHAETGLPVQTHISENKGEIELVREMFCGGAKGSNCDVVEDVGETYAGVYDRYGLLTDKTILAHAIHLSEAEASLISERGSKVSHCPCSNSSITSGAARVRWLLDKGIEVGLGTDVSGGYSPSILDAARQALLVSRHVALAGAVGDRCDDLAKLSVEEVLHLATRGGAAVVGLADRVGAFEVGFDWDAQLIELGSVGDDGMQEGAASVSGEDNHQSNVDIFGWETWEERIAKWLFNGDDRNTKRVWVRGRLVHWRK
ncbi:hypothetical protein PpBr36_04605 [Pyricularia pennisetigena]|uniref:hypothetical protein n=1 Tax=Pyricularia pennisetigena TaxID=1578925 RepID=UPI0011535706|nr:hypothetical protein PpBr36_04605 [Pyricularia pennisetigena]TLS27560.1 hypothetical protein PpBr36_04605 [Pyricularia pennisetigena]